MKELMTSGDHKNLNLDERFCIEQYLGNGLNFTEIAKLLNRNPKTISREVKGHRIPRTKDPALRKSKCAYLKACNITNLCSNKY
jgi:IS30 family transposase